MSTVKATNFQHASSATANMVTDASGNVSFGGTAAMSSSFLRNRIINGDMRIDQRNAGASVNSPSSAATVYTVDRWEGRGDTEGIFSMQQNSSIFNLDLTRCSLEMGTEVYSSATIPIAISF